MKFAFLFAVFLCASAESACLNALAANDPEWIRISVRDPNEPVFDSGYITRLNTATFEVFAPWFKDSNPSVTYQELLRQQHIVATTDEAGHGNYLGGTFRRKGTDYIAPGRFIFEREASKNPEGHKGGEHWYQWEQSFRDDTASRDLTLFLTRMSEEEFGSANEFSFSREIPRLAISILSKVRLKERRAAEHCVAYKDTERVLQTICEVIDDIRKVPSGSDPERVISLVGEFIYLGSVTHPFYNANFSIIMSQANFMLTAHGLRGIHHRGLDIFAYFFRYDRFQMHFSRLVHEINPALDWAAHFPVDSVEWTRVSVRDPAGPLSDVGYLQRAHDGVTHVFAPWFNGQANSLSFEAMLRAQHKILSNGLSGNETYQGASRREHNLRVGHKVKGGDFRFDSRDPNGAFSFSFSAPKLLPNDLSPRLRRLFDTYREIDPDPNRAEPDSSIADPVRLDKAIVESLDIPRTQVKVATIINRTFVTVTYPKHSESRQIFEAMESVMHDIRTLSRSERNIDTLIDDLAEYVYLATWAHLGGGANFSLAMSQVEYILHFWNLNGISHSNLDFVGLSRPFEEFAPRFYSDVQAMNPAVLKRVRKSEDPSFTDSVPLTILAHIADAGDLNFREDSFIGDLHKQKRIEGFAVGDRELPTGISLEYMAHLQGKGNTPWVNAGTFLGTRGESRPVNGLAIRVAGPEAANYSVVYQVRAGTNSNFASGRNGEFVGGLEDSAPITGLRISLLHQRAP